MNSTTASLAPMDGAKALARFEVKEVNAETRTFEGYASTWDMDLGWDMIHRGAFAKSLRDWKSSGRVIPLIDQHDYWTVRSVLGKLVAAKEDATGLWTKWLVTEGSDGDELLHRLRGGMVDGLSIGYEIVNSDEEVDEGKYVRHLREVKLIEVSVVIWGMNPNALVINGSVKSLRSLLDRIDRDTLSDEDLRELRRSASYIGTLLRPAGGKRNGSAVPGTPPRKAAATDTTATDDDAPAGEEEGAEGEVIEQDRKPTKAHPDRAATDEESPPASAAGSQDGEKEKTERSKDAPTYAYSEALRARLSTLTATADKPAA